MCASTCVEYFVLVFIGVILVTFARGKQIQCTDALDGEMFQAEDDCDAYYLCAHRTLVLIKCPEGFSFRETACVPTAFEASDCGTKRHAKRVKEQQIKNQKPRCRPTETGLKAHPRKCSLYLDCDANEFSRFREENTRECEYPTLFDEETLSCRDGSEVDCGSRTRPTDQCDYESNACLHGNCEPCDLRMSSCAGLPDGRHPLSATKKNPVYLLCSNGSLVEHMQCPFKDVGRRAHRTQMFNPESGQCELTITENKYTDGKNKGARGVAKSRNGKNDHVIEKPRYGGEVRGTETLHANENPREISNTRHVAMSGDNWNPRAETRSRDKQLFGNRRKIWNSRNN